MKLSWIGRSAIVVAGVIVLGMIGLQIFKPLFVEKILSNLSIYLVNLPLMLIASALAVLFLVYTKQMPKGFRSPWVAYSVFIFSSTGFVLLALVALAIALAFRNFDKVFESFMALSMLCFYIGFIFVFNGLGLENARKTGKKINDLSWSFVLISVVAIGIAFIPNINVSRYLSKAITTIICLIPAYVCLSIIRKSDKNLSKVYIIVFISQIAFIIVNFIDSSSYHTILGVFLFTITFVTFAVIFDLRTSIHLIGLKSKQAGMDNNEIGKTEVEG